MRPMDFFNYSKSIYKFKTICRGCSNLDQKLQCPFPSSQYSIRIEPNDPRWLGKLTNRNREPDDLQSVSSTYTLVTLLFVGFREISHFFANPRLHTSTILLFFNVKKDSCFRIWYINLYFKKFDLKGYKSKIRIKLILFILLRLFCLLLSFFKRYFS